jgi:hypothetical protein
MYSFAIPATGGGSRPIAMAFVRTLSRPGDNERVAGVVPGKTTLPS